MNICPNCNYNIDSPTNFCPRCGADIRPAQNPVQPTYQTTYSNQTTYTPYPVEKPNLAKKIVGMALSIFGFAFSIIIAIISLATMAIPEASFGLTVVYAIFSMPGSIIGFNFSNEARNLGDQSKLSSTGKSLGLAGIIITAAALFISFFAMIANA